MEAGPVPSTARPPATIRGSAGGGPMPPAPQRCPGRRRSVTAVGSEGKGTSQGEAGFAPRQPHGAACGAGGQLWQQAAGSRPDRQRLGTGKPAATLQMGPRVLGRRRGLGQGLLFAAKCNVPPPNPKGSAGRQRQGRRARRHPEGRRGPGFCAASSPVPSVRARSDGATRSSPRAPRAAEGCRGSRGRDLQQGWKPSRQGSSPGGSQEPTAPRPPAPLEGARGPALRHGFAAQRFQCALERPRPPTQIKQANTNLGANLAHLLRARQKREAVVIISI